MPNYFLLTAGDQYYPESGDGDWKGFYETYEDAESEVTREEFIIPCDYGDIHEIKYIIRGNSYDWYYIIDLTNRIN